MITQGKRLEGQPILVSGKLTEKLERVPFLTRSFNEDWIQKLIHDQPGILPIDEIDSSFAPLIPIGREIHTVVGCIDNLFISPQGYLTIVETKLWRNPEARREVVGQILDYAKEVNKWTYDDLDKEVKTYNEHFNRNSDGLLATIRREKNIECDEQSFIDNISRNLKRGRFLLLIVGDGIRESVEDMVEYLNQTPQLLFTLSLIELQVYKFKEKGQYIVIPQIILRTKEITRAIIRIESSSAEQISVNVEADLSLLTGDNGKNTSKRFTITAEDYFEQLRQNTDPEQVQFVKQIISDCEHRGYFTEWGQGSFAVKSYDPGGSGIKITLFVVDKKGMVKIGWTEQQLNRLGLPIEISHSYAADTASFFNNCGIHSKYKNSWKKDQSLSDLRLVYVQFMMRVDKFVKDITEKEKALLN